MIETELRRKIGQAHILPGMSLEKWQQIIRRHCVVIPLENTTRAKLEAIWADICREVNKAVVEAV